MIKKFVSCITVVLVLFLFGCKANQIETTTQIGTEAASTTAAPVSLSFKAQYIFAMPNYSYTNTKTIFVLNSSEELKKYYNENKDMYYGKLGRDNEYQHYTIGFSEAVEKYDNNYFKDHLLVFILCEEPSGTFRHKVIDVMQTDTGTVITVKRIVTYPATGDMAEWHIMVELKKAEYNGSPITVIFEPENPFITNEETTLQ